MRKKMIRSLVAVAVLLVAFIVLAAVLPGAQCDHVNHVSTQLPYALTVAAVSTVSYVLAGFVQNWLIVLPIAIVLMIATLLVIRAVTSRKTA